VLNDCCTSGCRNLRESGTALGCNDIVAVEVAVLLLAKKKAPKEIGDWDAGQTGMNWR
jgi:hypothetical protein